MKTIVFSVLCSLFFVFSAAQCPSGNISLNSQTDIDNFLIAYPNCTELLHNLNIHDDDDTIIDLSPLSNLTYVGGNLTVRKFISSTTLYGLHNIIEVGGDLTFHFNSGLTSLSELNNIVFVGGNLRITENPLLTSLSGLDNLISVGRHITIKNNNGLTSLLGLDNLESVEGFLYIGVNNALTSLSALSNLSSIAEGGILSGYGFTIEENNSLTSLSGLENIVSIEGGILIVNNPLLTSLTGLDNIESIGGNVVIDSNATLSSLSNFSELSSIGGLFRVSNNPQLTTLSGLNNLESIGGYLWISGNNALSDISAIQNIDPTTIVPHLTTGVTITNNPALSVCNLPNICTYLGYDVATRPRNISGNAGGCISVQAVQNACTLSVSDIGFSQKKLYPNPVESTLFLDQEVQKITLTDLTGKVLTTQNNSNQIDMSVFQNGVYLITIETDENVVLHQKLIKQ